MAAAIITRYTAAETAAPGVRLHFEILFFAAGVPGGGDMDVASVDVVGADTAAGIRGKITTAVLARATTLGYTVVASNVFIPEYQRGT